MWCEAQGSRISAKTHQLRRTAGVQLSEGTNAGTCRHPTNQGRNELITTRPTAPVIHQCTNHSRDRMLQ